MAKILIVDDSRTSRRMLRAVLEEIGYTEIEEAVNGEDGFIKYKEIKPDLVTMDITMPKLDGIEALELIKKYDTDSKVVMISAAGQREKMFKAIKYGAAEFITKPYEKNEVEKIIKGLLD